MLLAVTLNGVDFSTGHQQFTYHEHQMVTTLTPRAGPARGGVHIVVAGDGFTNATRPRCRFGVAGTSTASVLHDDA